MIHFFQDLMQYEFLRLALFTSVMVGIICGVIGSFIILRGLSLMGDAISHAVLPGVAISYMLGINYFYGAAVSGILSAVGIGMISQNSRVKSDASIGIVFSAALALGVILITKARSAQDLTNILFGNVLSVQSSDMWVTLGIGLLILAVVILFYKELLISSFDPIMSAAYGLNTKAIHYLIMILLTLVTVSSLKTVGVILVVSMLIAPASAAYLLTNHFGTMIFISAGLGALASVLGVYISFQHNLPTGPVIALSVTFLFILAFLFAPNQGLMWRSIKKRNHQKNTKALKSRK
ncbi:MAG TPA: metal ABC transporter permease [Fodinibius sp.]|nr:metal ABC transporter permease [Fodinibius sp.]